MVNKCKEGRSKLCHGGQGHANIADERWRPPATKPQILPGGGSASARPVPAGPPQPESSAEMTSPRPDSRSDRPAFDKRAVLRSHPIFGGLSADVIERLSAYAITQKVKRGKTIFVKG